MRRIVLTYGLIAGAILAVTMFISQPMMDQLGYDSGMIIGYTSMIAASMLIYFGIRTYRDSHGGGRIAFGRAFRMGLAISAISTVCYVASWEIVYYTMIPDFGEKYAAAAVEKLRANGKSAAEIAAKEKEMAEFAQMYKNPLVNIAFTFLEPLPVALLASLISAGLLSRSPKDRVTT